MFTRLFVLAIFASMIIFSFIGFTQHHKTAQAKAYQALAANTHMHAEQHVATHIKSGTA